MKLSQKKVLIFSLDTDVKMLSIYYTSTSNVEFIVRSGSNIVPSYFHPNKFISHIKNELKEESLIPIFARSMLKVFALLGCDFLPTFYGISHSLAMKVFMDMSKKSPLRIPEDFIKLMLKIYQEKYSSFKRLFPQESADVSDAIMGTREILKGAKGCEYEILPLPSVLKLQERRAEIVTLLWTGKLNDEQPNYFGFEMIENKWKPKLQMIDDPFYSNPKTWIEGCGCKSICFDQKNRCKCQNSPGRGNTCSPFTCKSCKCFKRVQESEDEDLTLSSQYQGFMDQLSDEDESESDYSFESLENDEEYREFVDLDDSFTE